MHEMCYLDIHESMYIVCIYVCIASYNNGIDLLQYAPTQLLINHAARRRSLLFSLWCSWYSVGSVNKNYCLAGRLLLCSLFPVVAFSQAGAVYCAN